MSRRVSDMPSSRLLAGDRSSARRAGPMSVHAFGSKPAFSNRRGPALFIGDQAARAGGSPIIAQRWMGIHGAYPVIWRAGMSARVIRVAMAMSALSHERNKHGLDRKSQSDGCLIIEPRRLFEKPVAQRHVHGSGFHQCTELRMSVWVSPPFVIVLIPYEPRSPCLFECLIAGFAKQLQHRTTKIDQPVVCSALLTQRGAPRALPPQPPCSIAAG